jgi:hypothetical protein
MSKMPRIPSSKYYMFKVVMMIYYYYFIDVIIIMCFIYCSGDCPIFYLRRKAILDLEEQDSIIRRFD